MNGNVPLVGNIRDAAEALFYIVAIFAAGGGLIRYFRDERERQRQRQEEIDQRSRELRWRQSEAAKSLLDDFVNDELARNAMLMLDSWSRDYQIEGSPHRINVEQWQSALTVGPDIATDPIASFVRDSFDAFLFHLSMFEHHVRNGFVLFEDVEFPISYYVRIMREDRKIYLDYLSRYELDWASAFLNRFAMWRVKDAQPVLV